MTRGNDAVPQIKWVDGDTIQYTYKGESAETTDITTGKKNYFSFFYNFGKGHIIKAFQHIFINSNRDKVSLRFVMA